MMKGKAKVRTSDCPDLLITRKSTTRGILNDEGESNVEL